MMEIGFMVLFPELEPLNGQTAENTKVNGSKAILMDQVFLSIQMAGVIRDHIKKVSSMAVELSTFKMEGLTKVPGIEVPCMANLSILIIKDKRR